MNEPIYGVRKDSEGHAVLIDLYALGTHQREKPMLGVWRVVEEPVAKRALLKAQLDGRDGRIQERWEDGYASHFYGAVYVEE